MLINRTESRACRPTRGNLPRVTRGRFGARAAGAVVAVALVVVGVIPPVATASATPVGVSSETCTATLTQTTITNPGAGNQISSAISGRWSLLSFRATFTASATAATRYPLLRLSDAASHVYYAMPLGTVTASQALQVNAAIGASAGSGPVSATFTGVDVALPTLMLPTGGVVDTAVNGGQSGDAWSAITYSYCYEDAVSRGTPVTALGTTPVSLSGTVPVHEQGTATISGAITCSSGCSGGGSSSSVCPSKSGTTTTSSTSTTLAPSEASTGELCTVNVATSAGLGLAGTTFAGLALFAMFAMLVISFRHRRA